MHKCDERIACIQAMVVYDALDNDAKKKIPEDFFNYINSNSGSTKMKKFISQMVVRQGFTAQGRKIVEELLRYVIDS